MFEKLLMGGSVIAIAAILAILIGTLSVVGVIIPTHHLAWGVTKFCNFPLASGSCIGTNSGDAMSGDGQSNRIFGCGGDDVISGAGERDFLFGDGVDIFQCPGGGNFGADRISGGLGDDFIGHGPISGGPVAFDNPDGKRDLIDCGPGNDEVFINFNVDNDVAVNCETIHRG